MLGHPLNCLSTGTPQFPALPLLQETGTELGAGGWALRAHLFLLQDAGWLLRTKLMGASWCQEMVATAGEPEGLGS